MSARFLSPALLVVLALAACGGSAEETADATSTTAPAEDGDLEAATCAPSPGAVEVAALADPALDEVSGMAASATRAGTLWLIEDSGNPAAVVAVDPDGVTEATVTLEDTNRDWEDLALAPGPSGAPHLFVAEIGDNAAAHPTVAVLRLPEPDPALGDQTVRPERLELRYPDGPRDAEALLVDPARGDLVLVTKSLDGTGEVYVAPALASASWQTDPVTLERVGTLTLDALEAVTAADVSPDGSVVAVRTPVSTLVWEAPDGEGVAATLVDVEPCPAPTVLDPLGEALAVDPADGSLLLLGEGAGATLYRATLTP